MNRQDLVNRLATQFSLPTAASARYVDFLLDQMEDSLLRGEPVRLYGFGTLTPQVRAARVARNPRTGETVNTPAKRVVKFKAGETLSDKLKAA